MSIYVGIATRKGHWILVDYIWIGDPRLAETCKARPTGRVAREFPTPPAWPDGGRLT